MNKINWKQKLSSRKFWAALIGFITSILYAFNIAESEITQIAGIITAGSTLVIYILTEGYVDANRIDYIEIIEEDLPPEDALE